MREHVFRGVSSAIRNTAQHALPAVIERDHSLISDLGFDSIGVAMLSMGLEDEFFFPVLLDTWIGAHDGPHDLTVDSLCRYMESLVREQGTSLPA